MELTFPGEVDRGLPRTRTEPEQLEKSTTVPKSRWSQFVVGVQDRYRKWKKGLVERTDKTLEQAADVYVEQYAAERDPVTGEVPHSYLRKMTRGFKALRRSSSIQNRFELAMRTALPFVEFNTQMAFKQFGIDIALRQAEYEELQHAYAARGGVAAVERQAMDFAQKVQAEFMRLNEHAKQLPPEAETNQEAFRQQKISAGLAYAEELLQGIELVDEGAKAKLLAELNTYLDTVVYDPSRPGILQRWDKLGRGYRGAIQDIMYKHVDIYQKRRARNKSIFTTSARWLTFGLEAYVLDRLTSAASTVRTNYDRALVQVPAEERTLVKRMQRFAESVKESALQFALNDNYRKMREQTTAIDEIIERELFSYDWESGQSKEFPVDEVTREFYAKFKVDLEQKGISEQQLYEMVEAEAYKIGNRRAQLADTLKYTILQLHREQVKASARQAEHVYNQYNINYTAVVMLADIDAETPERLRQVQEHVGTVLEQLSQADEVRTVLAQVEPSVNMAMGVVQEISASIQEMVRQAEIEMNPVIPEVPVYQPGEEVEPVPPVEPAQGVLRHIVAPKETLWGIAQHHVEAYRSREGNDDLSVADVVHLIQVENTIADPTKLEVGTELKLADWAKPDEGHWTDVVLEETQSVSSEKIIAAAKEVDAQKPSESFVTGVTRTNLEVLPPGEYDMALGERMGKASGRMPVYYSETAHISVAPDGSMTARGIHQSDDAAVTLDRFLEQHQSPIIRVFQVESEGVGQYLDVTVPVEHINPETMSQYNQALVRYLQDHPVTVLDKEGAYCAKDMAARLDLFDPALAADVGVNIRDGQGRETGVTVHAPMLAAAILSGGGQEVATLNQYFSYEGGVIRPTENLNSEDPEYRAGVQAWVTQAAESPFRLATFLYAGTHIQNIIRVNAEIGGEPNSHVVTLLGEKDLVTTVEHETSVAEVLRTRYGISQTDLADRGWIFESLGIEVRDESGSRHVVITDQADWTQFNLHPGETLVIHDVALNHRFNGDRADTLVTLLVRNDTLTPVSILEPNGQVVNEALAYKGEANDYVVDTFEQVQPGDSVERIFARAGMDPSLWKAAQFVLTERGVDPAHVESGELVPLYNEAELHEHLDEIYERAERRLSVRTQAELDTGLHYASADRAQAEAALETKAVTEMELGGVTYWHIVRPNESMDGLTQNFFDRSKYSVEEWNSIRTQVAAQLGIEQTKVEMPGDEFTGPYTVYEFHLTANAELHLTLDQLRAIDLEIEQHRLQARMYLPDNVPLYTSEGVVEQSIPSEVVQLIDATVGTHPEYGEEVRVALGLIYANEGMREGAEKNAVTRALTAVNIDHVLDEAIQTSEYATSRQMLKDVAWAVHDAPMAHYLLQEAITSFESGFASRQAFLHRMDTVSGGLFPAEVAKDYYDIVPATAFDQLVKLEGISSAGLFQVRANNFVPEGTLEFEQFERDLRADPVLNTNAAAELTHQNARVIDTYLQAFGDPNSQNEGARILALVNSYNGGPYKTILGGLQANMLRMEEASHIDTSLDRATGRNTTETREAFEQLCLGLSQAGKLHVSPEQIHQDVALLGSHTISFLRSETMREFKQAYANEVGHSMSLLPDTTTLGQAEVSYGNYVYLATRAGALDVILQHSEGVRLAKGQAGGTPYARSEAPFHSASVG